MNISNNLWKLWEKTETIAEIAETWSDFAARMVQDPFTEDSD